MKVKLFRSLQPNQVLCAERGVDLSAAQTVDLPTRDVLVVFDNEGDREFIGFGSAKADRFADCYISPDDLPEDTIRVSPSAVLLILQLAPHVSGRVSTAKALQSSLMASGA